MKYNPSIVCEARLRGTMIKNHRVITFLNLAELVADVDAVGAVVGRQADAERERRAVNRRVVKVARLHAQPPLRIDAGTQRHHSLIFTFNIHTGRYELQTLMDIKKANRRQNAHQGLYRLLLFL
jgi:hypothetical protein